LIFCELARKGAESNALEDTDRIQGHSKVECRRCKLLFHPPLA